MHDIFISYKREEQPMARKLADALQKKGWSVWWDPEIVGGERFHDVIDKALKESKCVVVLWSKLSVESKNVKNEATYALNQEKLVPIKIEEVDLPYWAETINTRQLIDWDGSDSLPEFQKLVSDISRIIAKEADQKREEVKVVIKPEKLGLAKVKPPESKPDTTITTEPKSAKLRKTNNALIFGAVAGVIVLLMVVIFKPEEKAADMHPVVSDLSSLASELADHKAVLRERRAAVTSYLERVHDLIQHAHDELEQGRVPHGTCQQIFDTGELLVKAIGDAVSSEDLARLREFLKGAYNVEILQAALKDESARNLNLAELDRTRGAFAALVEAISASPISRPR